MGGCRGLVVAPHSSNAAVPSQAGRPPSLHFTVVIQLTKQNSLTWGKMDMMGGRKGKRVALPNSTKARHFTVSENIRNKPKHNHSHHMVSPQGNVDCTKQSKIKTMGAQYKNSNAKILPLTAVHVDHQFSLHSLTPSLCYLSGTALH